MTITDILGIIFLRLLRRDTIAIKALSEIQEIIHNEKKSDFEIVDEIVYVFEKYNIDFGGCHDY